MGRASHETGPPRRRAPLARWSFLLAFLLLGLSPEAPLAAAPVYGYEFVARYPHDPDAFTQGLIVTGDHFYEGTGLYGSSSLRKVEVASGDVLLQYDLDPSTFGEGVTALRDTLYQLSWRNHELFTYVETDSFELTATEPYAWEGWGLTHDGTHLIASDGSATIRFLDPLTLEEISQIVVSDDGAPVTQLNELEYVAGRIYANIWYADEIAVIDPVSGLLDARLDLAGLRDSIAYDPGADVLNGIAYDAAAERLFVTGKFWPEIFEIRVPTLPMHAEDRGAASPSQALRLQCAPNPCRDRARVAFAAPSSGGVSLALFDAGGRRVHRLADGHRADRAAGAHTVAMDASGLPAGVYFLRCTTAHGSQTRAIHVIR
jgi:glutaminyl-peptide cyclotransferase